ncbi:hypothetical protein DV736_g2368, partial [Chaetothyriales sp. CBS 134916]
MSGLEVIGGISAVIAIIDGSVKVWDSARKDLQFSATFETVANRLPILRDTLQTCHNYFELIQTDLPADAVQGMVKTVESCKSKAEKLGTIFNETIPGENDQWYERYRKVARRLGKGSKVEELLKAITEDAQNLVNYHAVKSARPDLWTEFEAIIKEMQSLEPSIPGDDSGGMTFNAYGGTMYNSTGSSLQYINPGAGNQINYGGAGNPTFNLGYADDSIDRDCFRALRCPDARKVKNQLRENKDKLIHKSFEWILQDPQYVSWQDSPDVGLLWIRGGAGKGKTMMSIGLIEQLACSQDHSTVVIYFFCQNANYELNTIEAIIKGLILQLANQQKELKESLRSRWDSENKQFNEDITFRMLWDVFLEMLERCNCRRANVVVDGLDECQGEGMSDFLRLIVRTGLSQPSKIKWLLTSRPLDSAEQELLAGSDQVAVSLELNSQHVSEAVKTYIAAKVTELGRRYRYDQILRQKLEAELTEKAEHTFLWVSLVCKRLEGVPPDKVLVAIQDLQPGLIPFYHRIFNQLSEGEPAVIKECMRLLKAMMLTYRPLNMAEVSGVTGLPNEDEAIQALVSRCASFAKMRGTNIEFVHKSAQDYLAGENGQSVLDSLKVNLVGLPRPDSTWEDKNREAVIASFDYTATFWAQHLDDARRTAHLQDALAEHGEVITFLRTKMLEWLECLSLLDKLPLAIDALKILTNTADLTKSLSILVQDATRFLLRHYQTLATWPLQIYSSAIVFSPQTSIVRRENLDKVPGWLRNIPRVEDTWTSLIQTLAGHSNSVTAVAFSPDSKQIASGSYDKTIKLWDTTTGNLQKTLAGHSDWVRAVAFSPDGKQIVSGSDDKTIKLWDT